MIMEKITARQTIINYEYDTNKKCGWLRFTRAVRYPLRLALYLYYLISYICSYNNYDSFTNAVVVSVSVCFILLLSLFVYKIWNLSKSTYWYLIIGELIASISLLASSVTNFVSIAFCIIWLLCNYLYIKKRKDLFYEYIFKQSDNSEEN